MLRGVGQECICDVKMIGRFEEPPCKMLPSGAVTAKAGSVLLLVSLCVCVCVCPASSLPLCVCVCVCRLVVSCF